MEMAENYMDAIREKLESGSMEDWQADKLSAVLTLLEFTFDSLDS